jgi:hypothetical protein
MRRGKLFNYRQVPRGPSQTVGVYGRATKQGYFCMRDYVGKALVPGTFGPGHQAKNYTGPFWETLETGRGCKTR